MSRTVLRSSSSRRRLLDVRGARRRLRLALLASGLASLSACIPITVSTRCREAAHSCLDGCPSSNMPVREEHTLGSSWLNDSRNSCEKRCHDVASSCEADEREK